MPSKNKFGFDPIDPAPKAKRERSVGPMGAAVREAAESLQETTDAKVEQRRRNAEDAKTFRAAKEQGLVLHKIPLAEVSTTDLPRDRLELEAVAASDEMEELKASIRARGQKEPVELYRDSAGQLQLKKGWRRFTALSQLFAETANADFSTIIARVEEGRDDRLTRYVDMVEENVVREDLTFAEMAQVAIAAAQDPATEETDPDAMVMRLYGSLHKMKRSYIRNFVFLLSSLGDALQWPKDVKRNLGVQVARGIKSKEEAKRLRRLLRACSDRDAQTKVLADFAANAEGEAAGKTRKAAMPKTPQEKFEFRMGKTKVTARRGECRIVSEQDFSSIPKGQLEAAVRAFEEALERGNPRVTGL